MPSPSPLIVAAFDETVRLEPREIVDRLNGHLGATLVATLAGVSDRKLPYRWARADGAPNSEAMGRLTVAHRIWSMLAEGESDTVARAWFIGENPYLDEQAPVLALREGNTRQTLLAAEAFVSGTWQG